MDIDAALREIREIVKMLDGMDKSDHRYQGLVADLIGTVNGLDDSLTRGMFLPKEWATNTADAKDVRDGLWYVTSVQDHVEANEEPARLFVKEQLGFARQAFERALSVSK